jgi:hypothetical protein
MRNQTVEPLEPVTGVFSEIVLSFVPEFPPLPEDERRSTENYPTTLAYLHVLLDGRNVSNRVSSAYILWLLDHLLHGIGDLVCGRSAVAGWVADPWRFDLESDPEPDQVEMILHFPPKRVAMKSCIVPLGKFGRCPPTCRRLGRVSH